METAWRYIMKGFSVISRLWRSAPYYLTFVRSQRLYHMKLYLLLFPILHVFIFFKPCASSSVYHTCVRSHASPSTEQSAHFMSCSIKWPASSIFSHTQCGPQCAQFTGYDQGAQQDALAKPQERTSLCVPGPIHLNQTDICTYYLCDFNLRIRP